MGEAEAAADAAMQASSAYMVRRGQGRWEQQGRMHEAACIDCSMHAKTACTDSTAMLMPAVVLSMVTRASASACLPIVDMPGTWVAVIAPLSQTAWPML